MRRIILLALFVSGVPLAAGAQNTPATPAPAQSVEEVRKNSSSHLGPFYLSPALQLKELGWDSNVFNQAGEQQSDFMFNLSPKLRVWVPMARRALLTTTAAVDLVWYSKYRSERSVDPQFTGRGEVYLHRLTLFAEDAFLRTRQRLNYEIDLRAEHNENNLAAGAQYRITPKFSVELAGRRGATTFDGGAVFLGSSLQQRLDRTTTGATVTTRHRLSPLTTLAVRGERFDDRFRFDPTRDSRSVRVMPGIEFKPRALVSGSAYVGYRTFRAEHPEALRDFSGLVADVGLSYTLLGSTTFGVSYVQDVTYSFELLQPYFVGNTIGGSLRRSLGRRYDVLVSLDRARYEYRDSGSTGSIPDLQRADTTWNYGASFGYRVGRVGRVGLGATYVKRQSTVQAFRDYDGLRVGTTVTYGF